MTLRQPKTQSIAFMGITIALLIVSAWITVPFGPVPFTLQTFVIVFALLVLEPKEAVTVLVLYILLGALGLPVFSGMRGGVGVLFGPTGGFLWGFLLGGVLVAVLRRRLHVYQTPDGFHLIADSASAALFLLVSYVCGWAQLMVVAQLDPVAAFMAGIAPFIVIDIVKLAVAVVTSRAVIKAVGRR